jgi:signal transduction histidine kinase
VEQMGGEINFTSDPGTATTFWFTVPLLVSAGA